MGKRSDFDRLPRDRYDTPAAAVWPLLPHLRHVRAFAEPCAGAGRLVAELEATGGLRCVFAGDVEPRGPGIERADALALDAADVVDADAIITNPPWARELLHPMIAAFASLRPTWLLLDADWMHTAQARPFLGTCRKIVSVGRVKWIAGSPHTGKDNAAWYLFDGDPAGPPTVFVGRSPARVSPAVAPALPLDGEGER